MWFRFLRHPMLDDDNKDGGGNKGTNVTFNMNEFVKSVLAQNGGDKDATIRQLGRDAKKARDSRNRHKQRADTAEAELKKLKSPGSKVFEGDELKEVEAFLGLKVKAQDVKDGLAERDTLKEFKTNTERGVAVAKASKLLGYKQPTVLLDQLNSHGQDLSFKKEKGDDDAEVEVPYVTKRGEQNAKPVKLSAYVDEHLKTYIPSLMASDEDSNDEDEHVTPVPGSGPAARGKPSTRKGNHPTDKYLKGRYAGVIPGVDDSSAAESKKS